MECTWDAALLRHGDQLPPELLQIMQHGSNERYLQAITRATLDPRFTYKFLAHCEDLIAHSCATFRSHGSLASSVATLGRIIPFAPYLMPFAIALLGKERYDFSSSSDTSEDLSYLLGLFRLFSFDWRTIKKFVHPTEIATLLQNSVRPIVYLAIRILQIYVSGADHWFEQMMRKYLGEDTLDSDIDGQWDDKVIDYRFLTLWEEERLEHVRNLIGDIRSTSTQQINAQNRVIPETCFDPSTALVGSVLLPRRTLIPGPSSAKEADLVQTPTIANNLGMIASALKCPRPLLLTGLAGSGKSLLVRHIAHKLGKIDKMVTLHLNEQSDAKLLIGIYTTGDIPRSFVWRPGVLTTALQEGRWVLIEDLDRAPNEIIGMLLPLIEKGELPIPNRKQTIYAAQGFRIIATVRSTVNNRGEQTRPMANMLGIRHWQNVAIEMPASSELRDIAIAKYPSLSGLLPQMMAVYEQLSASRQRAVLTGQSQIGVLRPISPRDLLKWCGRVANLLRQRTSFTSSDVDDIFMEAVDCLVGALPDGPARTAMTAVIAEELRIDPQRRDYLLNERDARYAVDKSKISVGRYSLPRAQPSKKSSTDLSTFSTNPHTSRMLERVAAAVVNREPLLLVGETGVGKTTAVQHLAGHLGKNLVAFNLSQQSEAGDLLGGFKPVSPRSLIVPLKDEFDELFGASFSFSKNQQFLELLGKQFAKSNWKAVCKLWQQALKMVEQQRSTSVSRRDGTPSKKRKIEQKTLDFARWDTFAANISDLERRLTAGSDAFAFSFVEGSIIKAVRHGDWILLDEINLASFDTLEAIADLLDPTAPSILLTESGAIERIEAHAEFRVFAAMNPATDVGKKDLQPGIRSRFTELYVESPDKDMKSLQSIVTSYLRSETAADPAVALDTSTLYQKIIALASQNKLVDGAGQKPHFSLRTLTRTLSYARYIAPLCSLRRALYEGFQMSFLTFLDTQSARLVHPLFEQHLFGKKTNVKAELQKALRKPTDGHAYVLGYQGSKHWVRQGTFQVEEQPQYIITPFIRGNLENLIRAASTRQFPVLIQGPTSSGKTSMIEYLAKRTGHKFVRINNHEHTDLQEYLGTYVSGTDGRLQFQEGILVKALREGHWIVLDELNLAPTDVLEALNRLLDDNRELLIPETQEVVRPHENFMLFATQNPAGLYGGRKTLSRAFRNRFLELHFDDIPVNELQEILHKRTQLPESRCKRIVTVYRELSVLRQENRLFEQKSFATLRDLFRWALRPNDTIEQLAANGFMLLAERVRKPEERQILKDVLEKVMSTNGPRVSIDETSLYGRDCAEITQYAKNARSQDVVWTKAMRKLYVLVSRAIQNNEPVLLVGETGCGKTTVCQMLADAFGKDLHTVNAHQNTETGDLIGSQRPIRNRVVIEADLRHQLLSSPLLQSVDLEIDDVESLLNAYDHVVVSLEAESRDAYLQSTEHAGIQMSRTRFKALFEWADGSLVQAMRSGAFFLLDEISLADDSVLERINSVLEPQRSILLAEKGSLDSFVSAQPSFQFFATMNPGGDYGKRELSPALRNRFTEIWVPSLTDAEDITQIVSTKLAGPVTPYANVIVAFAQWFKDRYNTSASSSVSIRDALAWVDFANRFGGRDPTAAIVHGAAMVYIDTLGANPAGLMSMTRSSLEAERAACFDQLGWLLDADAANTFGATIEVTMSHDEFTVGRFSVSRIKNTMSASTFSFEPPTTRTNTMRVVRALQLLKPILLEGSPGVGKTALVTAVADAIGMRLTRINLSEQTDLIDLFGSDVPVEGEQTGTFIWRDAPFLRAMKNGEWVLLDEMNLASQSVLEGLNACLDHRGEVLVPELGQTFTRHPEFRLFAAQNPHHQGGGRKGLPASFVNRFTVVFADAFRSEDLLLICRQSFPHVDAQTIEKAVSFVEQLDHEVAHNKRFGANGGPWEFNLRDLTRWLSLASSEQGLLTYGSSRDFVDFLFTQRFRTHSDKAFIRDLFSQCFEDTQSASDFFSSISSQQLQLGLALLPRNPEVATPPPLDPWKPAVEAHLHSLQSIMLAVRQRWPVILTGPPGSGKTAIIERLARTLGVSVVRMAMNAETDAMDLLGGYEQADPNRRTSRSVDLLGEHLDSKVRQSLLRAPSLPLLEARELCNSEGSIDPLQISALYTSANRSPPAEVVSALQSLQNSGASVEKAKFEWIDGLLIEALQQGKWLVLENANLSSSSVLDRLNSLLEPNGALIVNEHSGPDGAPRIIYPHADFRIFLTLDPKYGELSRAMRNRAVELHLSATDDINMTICSDPLRPESALARLPRVKALSSMSSPDSLSEHAANILVDHLGLVDKPLLSRFGRQLTTGLYGLPRDHLQRLSSAVTRLPWDLLDCRREFEGFYEATKEHLQASADFASVQVSGLARLVSTSIADGKISVQTFHPLNNQALIQTSQHTHSQASLLAFVYDAGVRLASMSAILEAVMSDSMLPSRLQRLDRSVSSQSHSDAHLAKGNSTLGLIEKMLTGLRVFLQHLASSTIAYRYELRRLLDHLCAFWITLCDVIKRDEFDVATRNTSFSVGQSIVQAVVAFTPPELLPTFTEMSKALISSSGQPERYRGSACRTLWRELRPSTPSTFSQLDGLLSFEAVADRFDRLCWQFSSPLDAMVNLRLSFTRALQIGKVGSDDLVDMTGTLEKMMLECDSGQDEDSAVRPPHFVQTFKRLSARYAILSMGDWSISNDSFARLGLLALRKSTSSTQASASGNPSSLFCKLGSHASTLLEQAGNTESDTLIERSLLAQLSCTNQVSLDRFELLQAEMKALGFSIASYAHAGISDELAVLDSSLRDMLSKVLYLMSTSTTDGPMRDLASSALALMDQTSDSSRLSEAEATEALERLYIAPEPTVGWLSRQFHAIATYLLSTHSYQDVKISEAANAWASFACSCLWLYIPDSPFDPASEPRLRREIHRNHREDLSARLRALLDVRRSLTGTAASLRANMLGDDIAALGPEPEVDLVCRPEASQLLEIQTDLDALMRTLQPIWQEHDHGKSALPLEQSLVANLARIRGRLTEQYRAYDDFTCPVVGFVDCLLMAQRLSSVAHLAANPQSSGTQLANILPFVDASLDSWVLDQSFVKDPMSQKQELLWLEAVAIRSRDYPFSDCSQELQRAIESRFRRFYIQWKTELSQNQKKADAKSNVYKYKGEDDAQDDMTAEDLEELFPVGRETDSVLHVESTGGQDLSSTIASLHHRVFAPQAGEGAAFGGLLRQSLAVVETNADSEHDESLVPITLLAISEEYSRLTSEHAAEHYDIYTDVNIREVEQLLSLLKRVIHRFEEIHRAWPDHATPIEVLRLCEDLLATSHATPLSRFLPHVEKLHATVNEWQKIASREFSVSEALDAIVNTVVRWRQLELSTWARLFDREWEKCESVASSWWYIAYETMIEATSDFTASASELRSHTKGLIKTLGDFLASSGLGEFAARLRMLRGFEAHLAVSKAEKPHLQYIHQGLWNFLAYHTHFETSIAESLSEGRRHLEKEIKDIIQIASWKDRNIDVLRQSAQSSHKKLLRVVRKYRNLLAKPVIAIIQNGLSTRTFDTAAYTMADRRASIPTSRTEIMISASSLVSWDNRPDRFRRVDATARLVAEKAARSRTSLDAPQRLDDFNNDLNQSVAELQKATPSTLTEKNKAVVSHLKSRKRRLLADVLKDVRSMGFQTALSQQDLAKQVTLDAVLAHLSILPSHDIDSVASAEYRLHQLLGVMPAVRESARKHSEDLTPAEVARCTALLESMLQSALVQHRSISSDCVKIKQLRGAVDKLYAFGSCKSPTKKHASDFGGRLKPAHISSLGSAIRLCADLLRAQAALGNNDYSSAVHTLEDYKTKVTQLDLDLNSLPELPIGIKSQQTEALQSRWNELTDELQSSMNIVMATHPASRPLVSQLQKWTHLDSSLSLDSHMSGHTPSTAEAWISDLLQMLDVMLSSIQDVEKAGQSIGDTESPRWLFEQRDVLSQMTQLSRVETITQSISALMSQLQYLEGEDLAKLSAMAAMCQILNPVVDAYCDATTNLVSLACKLYEATSNTAFRLATSFVQLADRGFCSPSEKSKDQNQIGDVESGTGLGEGEGGEDISKNIGGEEDLSEIAQEADSQSKDGDLENEQDAVDMADQELEGKIDDGEAGSEHGKDDNADGDDGEAANMDEQTGEVDDLGASTIDEKMWDSGKDESRHEKEADSGKGEPNKDDLSSAQNAHSDDVRNEQNEEGLEDNRADEDMVGEEEAERESAEKLDSHVNDEEKLDLPENMEMDGKQVTSDDSDMDVMSESEEGEPDAMGPPQVEQENTIDDEDTVEEDNEDATEAAPGTENEEDHEDLPRNEDQDMLMQDEQPTQEEVTEGAVFADEGPGPETNELDEQTAQAKGTSEGVAGQENPERSEQDRDEGDGAADHVGNETSQSADAATDNEPALPFKQLGDVLEQWYDQHRRIADARETDRSQGREQPDPASNLAEAQFEHLPDTNAVPDAQALGAASAEQSTALDEDNAVPVNDAMDPPELPFERPEDQKEPDVAEKLQSDKMSIEPSDTLDLATNSTSFVGEPNKIDEDVEMQDEASHSEYENEDINEVFPALQNFEEDIPEELSFDDARQLWLSHEESTRHLALVLTEHLRLILQPTQATKMRGDFRTGKRLNIKRIIPYIASSYKRDKIWMRRSVPSKRSYQVMLAIDVSKSMKESQSQGIAFETLALVAKSMSMLEVGELCVVGFGEDVKVAHEFDTPFTSEAGAETFKHFNFSQSKTNVRKLLTETIEMFRTARLKAPSSSSDLWQLQLIVSDGICEDHPTIRQLVRQAHEQRIMIVFIVVDSVAHAAQGASESKQSILDLQTAEFTKDEAGDMQLKMVKYLDTFPFRYYLIVRDVQELPSVLAGALRQWFAEVVEINV